jgi:hypothetical protein
MTAIDINLPHNFTARPYQEDFFSAMNKGCNRAVLVWNRRAGKDTCSWNFLIYTAVEKKGIYYYVFPTFAQGRKVLWDGMTNDGFRFMDFIPKELIKRINNQEMKLTLVNGSLIQVIGSDNYDAIMGTNPTGCIFSEYSIQNPNAWQYIRPIIDANDGWAIFVFTPRGSNHAKNIYDMALHNKNWFCQKLTLNETKVITKEQLENIRAEDTSEDMIQQEWYCSFTLGIMGSYYSHYLTDLWDKKQIGNVPWDTTQKVYTSWDIGIGDSCSILFWQVCGNEIHLIDYFENHGEGLPYYAKYVLDKPYIYGSHFAPHDIAAREFGSGHSRKAVAEQLGISFTVLKTLQWSVDEGIEAVRGQFPRFWIDHVKCKHVIKSLENYQKQYDESREIYKDKPLHSKFSHCADSVRYMSIAIKDHLQAPHGPSDNDVEALRDKYQPRFS